MPLVATDRAADPGRNNLQDTGSHLGHDGHERGELGLFRIGARHGFPRCAAMPGRATERHTQSPRSQSAANNPAHRIDISGGPVVLGAITHQQSPDRRVWNLGSDVDCPRHPLQRVEILAE